MQQIKQITHSSEGYELLDSGNGEKLERFGERVLWRPDPQALWPKRLSEAEWTKAGAVYSRAGDTGKWSVKDGEEDSWQVKLSSFTFNVKLLPSKHIGLFPEQVSQWKWLEEKIKPLVQSGRPISVLNLFAYTGGATLACARAGASVCHVDASKFPVDYANLNLKDSGLGDKPVRFIVDDVRKFVEREIKRGNKYDVVLMDPPVYGKGTNDKVWKIEEDLLPFLYRVKEILSPEPTAVVINGYASMYSATTYGQMLSSVLGSLGGKVEVGELSINESNSERVLPAGIFARFEI